MIKAPNWHKNAVATTRGWAHSRTGELLISRRYTQEECDEYNEPKAPEPKVAVKLPEVKKPEVVVKSPEVADTPKVKTEKPKTIPVALPKA